MTPPYDIDVADTAIVFERPAVTIRITGPDDDQIERIELPPVTMTRAEAREISPAWLAAHDAEEREPTDSKAEGQTMNEDDRDKPAKKPPAPNGAI
jgi:hypothetical protein